MSEGKVIKLFTDGEISMKDRKFTRLLGGFNNNEATLSDLQIANILEYKHGARQVRERVNKNIGHFTFGLDIMNIKSSDVFCDTSRQTLKSLGYTEQAINLSRTIYLFSRSGFLLFLKFAEGDKAVEVYKDFIEEYFKLQAENQSMKESIEDEIKELEKEKAQYLGQSLLNKDEQIRIKYATKSEELTRRIIALEKSQSEKEIIKKVQDKINIADKIGSSKDNIDIGNFAKALGVKGVGRNKLFAWLREQEILRTNNVPYQRYMDYFSVQTIPGNNGHTYYKTLLKPTAIKYILKRLNKDDIVIEKSVDDILNELNEIA